MKALAQDAAIRVKMLERCDLVFESRIVNGMNVVELPRELLRYFDNGYHAIRINSTETAKNLPDFGGGTAVGRSQIPHQDHAPTDPRRFLAFSKQDPGKRGSETYLTHPSAVEAILPSMLRQFEHNRLELRAKFVHRPPYMISDAELMHCFDVGGLETVASSKVGSNPSHAMRLFVYAGLLTYVLQGDLGDKIVEDFLATHGASVMREPWETPGTLIIDNARIFHGRYGPNVRLKRNWVVMPQERA